MCQTLPSYVLLSWIRFCLFFSFTLYLLMVFLYLTFEMPIRPGVRINNTVHSTRRSEERPNQQNLACGLFHNKISQILTIRWIIEEVKSVTVVEGDLKSPFSIATTPRCRAGRYSFLSIKQVPFFESLVWLDLGLNPGLSGH